MNTQFYKKPAYTKFFSLFQATRPTRSQGCIAVLYYLCWCLDFQHLISSVHILFRFPKNIVNSLLYQIYLQRPSILALQKQDLVAKESADTVLQGEISSVCFAFQATFILPPYNILCYKLFIIIRHHICKRFSMFKSFIEQYSWEYPALPGIEETVLLPF